MDVIMENNTFGIATSDVAIRQKPQKYSVTVSTCIAMICGSSYPFMFLLLIAGQKYSKGL